jgi:hypothetical protein
LGKGGNLQTDAAQFCIFVPIPAKAKKLGLLSIYKFSLLSAHGGLQGNKIFFAIVSLNTKILKGCSENCINKFEEKIPGRACCAS